MKLILLITLICVCLIPAYYLLKNNGIIGKPKNVYTPQELTADEKEYPIRDGFGNKFKTMPTVYHKDIYVYSKNIKQYHKAPDNWAMFEPLWIDGKPAIPSIIHITEYSYTPFYTATISLSDYPITYNGMAKLPDTAKKMTPIIDWSGKWDKEMDAAHPTQAEIDEQ